MWCVPSVRRVHAGDEARPARGAHAGDAEGVGVAHRRLREGVEVRRDRVRVAVAAEVRAHVLAGDPEDVRPARSARLGFTPTPITDKNNTAIRVCTLVLHPAALTRATRKHLNRAP